MMPKDFPEGNVFASWQPVSGEDSREMDLPSCRMTVPVVKLSS